MAHAWQVEVDDMHYIFDVEAPCRHPGSNHYRGLGCTESPPKIVVSNLTGLAVLGDGNIQRVFALSLSTVGVDRSTWQPHVEQVIIK